MLIQRGGTAPAVERSGPTRSMEQLCRQTIHGLTWDAVAARHGLDANAYRVGDGWADLVDRLLTDLESMGWRRTPITRLEEKYGELRFEAGNPSNPPSYEGWSSEWEDRVDEAERESDRTCSRCGRLPRRSSLTAGSTNCALSAQRQEAPNPAEKTKARKASISCSCLRLPVLCS